MVEQALGCLANLGLVCMRRLCGDTYKTAKFYRHSAHCFIFNSFMGSFLKFIFSNSAIYFPQILFILFFCLIKSRVNWQSSHISFNRIWWKCIRTLYISLFVVFLAYPSPQVRTSYMNCPKVKLFVSLSNSLPSNSFQFVWTK